MQLNITFLKRILNAIKDRDSHYVSVSEVMECAKPEFEEIDKESYKDVFYGHLLLLRDNGVIENISGCDNLGISYTHKGITTTDCKIRLTSKGYDFSKVLNKEGITEKLKRLTLTESIKVGEYILFKGIDQIVNML